MQPTRRLTKPATWPELGLGMEVCFSDVGIVLAHARSREAVLLRRDTAAKSETVLLPEHIDLKLVDSKRLSFIGSDRQTVGLFDLHRQATESQVSLPFGATSALFTDKGWLVARHSAGKLLHRLGPSGDIVESFGSTEEADRCPFKSWAGTIDAAIVLAGTLARLDERSFVYAYHALPLVQAYDIDGRHLWTTTLKDHNVRSQAALDARWTEIKDKNPAMAAGHGLIFPVVSGVQIGPNIGVLQTVAEGTDRRLVSLLNPQGSWLGTKRIEKDVVAVAWNGGQLFGARISEQGEITLESIEVNMLEP